MSVSCRNSYVVLALAGIAAGCGGDPYSELAPVTGTVLCEGKPAVGGTVIFWPGDASAETGRPKGNPGRISTAVVKDDGTFELIIEQLGDRESEPGALIGPHTITFQEGPTVRRTLDPRMIASLRDNPDELAKQKARIEAMPVYESLPCGTAVSPSSVQVKAGSNRFDLTLTGAASKPPSSKSPPVLSPVDRMRESAAAQQRRKDAAKSKGP